MCVIPGTRFPPGAVLPEDLPFVWMLVNQSLGHWWGSLLAQGWKHWCSVWTMLGAIG